LTLAGAADPRVAPMTIRPVDEPPHIHRQTSTGELSRPSLRSSRVGGPLLRAAARSACGVPCRFGRSRPRRRPRPVLGSRRIRTRVGGGAGGV